MTSSRKNSSSRHPDSLRRELRKIYEQVHQDRQDALDSLYKITKKIISPNPPDFNLRSLLNLIWSQDQEKGKLSSLQIKWEIKKDNDLVERAIAGLLAEGTQDTDHIINKGKALFLLILLQVQAAFLEEKINNEIAFLNKNLGFPFGIMHETRKARIFKNEAVDTCEEAKGIFNIGNAIQGLIISGLPIPYEKIINDTTSYRDYVFHCSKILVYLNSAKAHLVRRRVLPTLKTALGYTIQLIGILASFVTLLQFIWPNSRVSLLVLRFLGLQ